MDLIPVATTGGAIPQENTLMNELEEIQDTIEEQNDLLRLTKQVQELAAYVLRIVGVVENLQDAYFVLKAKVEPQETPE